MDDETSIGVLQAISEANRDDIKVITGGGGCQEYFNMMKENENIWIESSLYSPLMVKDAVDMALDVLAGKDVEPVKIISTTVVDRDNVDEYLDRRTPFTNLKVLQRAVAQTQQPFLKGIAVFYGRQISLLYAIQKGKCMYDT